MALSGFLSHHSLHKPLSRSRHFGFETRLGGHKRCTQNKLCILKIACDFVSAYPWENYSKINVYYDRSVCQYYKEGYATVAGAYE